VRSKVHGQERAALAKQGARVGTSEVSGACGAFAYVGGSMRPMGMERLNALNKTLPYTLLYDHLKRELWLDNLYNGYVICSNMYWGIKLYIITSHVLESDSVSSLDTSNCLTRISKVRIIHISRARGSLKRGKKKKQDARTV
jgi:hypothetical protein